MTKVGGQGLLRAASARFVETIRASGGAFFASGILASGGLAAAGWYESNLRSDQIATAEAQASLETQRILERSRQQLAVANDRLALGIDRGDRSTSTSPDLTALAKRLSDIEASQAKLNTLILASPDKALELPLMRRDFDDARARQADEVAALKRDIDRVYDLNKWLLGGIAVSIMTLGFANFLKAPPRP